MKMRKNKKVNQKMVIIGSTVSAADAATLLCVSRSTLRRWEKAGIIRRESPGRYPRFSWCEISRVEDIRENGPLPYYED